MPQTPHLLEVIFSIPTAWDHDESHDIIHRCIGKITSHYGGVLNRQHSDIDFGILQFSFDRAPLGPELLFDLLNMGRGSVILASCQCRITNEHLFLYEGEGEQ